MNAIFSSLSPRCVIVFCGLYKVNFVVCCSSNGSPRQPLRPPFKLFSLNMLHLSESPDFAANWFNSRDDSYITHSQIL